MKNNFFQAVIMSILLYGCTTWTLTKRLEKRLDGNYTRMLQAILNRSWGQHPTKQQLYGHLSPIKLDEPDMQDTAGEVGTSLLGIYSYGPLHMAKQKQGDQLKSTYSSSVRIWGVALRTCQKRWAIRRGGKRGSGISMLMAWQDDENEEVFYLAPKFRSWLVALKVRGAFNKFPDFFVQAFKIVIDSWKFCTLLIYILWDD